MKPSGRDGGPGLLSTDSHVIEPVEDWDDILLDARHVGLSESFSCEVAILTAA